VGANTDRNWPVRQLAAGGQAEASLAFGQLPAVNNTSTEHAINMVTQKCPTGIDTSAPQKDLFAAAATQPL